MSASVIPWASIALFHNTVKTLNLLLEREQQPLPCVKYQAKIKLHGTNGAIQRTKDRVLPQSRTTLLEPGVDNKGFGNWVRKNQDVFLQLSLDTTVFGEWCGPGVEKGMAVSALDRNIFAVFALQHGFGDTAYLEIFPDKIKAMLPAHPDLFVLPWHGDTFEVDFSEDLTKTINSLNIMVDMVEKEDPWVKDLFGIQGVGEGLVFYPLIEGNLNPDQFSSLGFKAKGEKHRTVASKKAVQVDPEIAESALGFAKLAVTEARLVQGVTEACDGEYSMKHMGTLLRWIEVDVVKECQAELEDAKLTWKQVSKPIAETTRNWYRSKTS